MSPEIAEILTKLQRRIDSLERSHSRRGFCNQEQAAAYLNRSVEWLRQQHAAGRGPKRKRRGRFYDYSYEDLDAYREAEGDDA